MQLTGVYKTRTTPFHPQSDGLTERANRTILQMLRAVCQDDPSDWPGRLPAILAAYRMTTHSVTGVSPNKAMLGREVLLPCTLIAAPPQDQPVTTVFGDSFRTTLREAHQLARENLNASAQTQKRYYDARIKPIRYVVGQLVWLYWPRPLIRQQQRKLMSLWTGPWRVEQQLTPLTVAIKHTTTGKRQVVHVDRLLPCSPGPDPLPPSPSPVVIEHQQSQPAGTGAADVGTNVSLSFTKSGRQVRRPARFW